MCCSKDRLPNKLPQDIVVKELLKQFHNDRDLHELFRAQTVMRRDSKGLIERTKITVSTKIERKPTKGLLR